jgi:hypothetical protein
MKKINSLLIDLSTNLNLGNMKITLLIYICLYFALNLQAQVPKEVNITAGNLSYALTSDEKDSITDLTITGTIDARDFNIMKDSMPKLAVLDIQNVTIDSYSGDGGTDNQIEETTYPANAIPQYAFYRCANLKNIYLPLTLIIINPYAFYGCSGFKTITIPPSVLTISKFAFDSCNHLASINIPEGVTSIGERAFSACLDLKTVTIPSSITSIEESVFDSCYSLKTVNIPSSVTSIGKRAFSKCSNMQNITIPSSVISIGEYAFSNCNLLLSITIPSSVTSIGDGAFNECVFLKSVELSSSITTIGKSMFFYCLGLRSIHIPSSVISIGENAFSECYYLKTVNIPSSVTSIGKGAFSYCDGIESIEIPSSVTSIGDHAFTSCDRLKSIDVFAASIGEHAFSSCNSLTALTINPSVTSIGKYAFGNCYNLKSVTIPLSVAFIGEGVFSYCTGLNSIFANNPTPVDLSSSPRVFDSVDKTSCCLLVPIGSKNLYSSANQWKDFLNIDEGDGLWVSNSDILFEYHRSSQTVKIFSDTTWTISSDQTWLTTSSNSGKGDSSIVLTASTNFNNLDRSAIVTVSEAGFKSRTVNIIQKSVNVSNEDKNIDLEFTHNPPEIDGFKEEAWDYAEPIQINKNFKEEKSTVIATWQALWDCDYFYVLVSVEDDNHWPSWEKAGANSWQYDKVELYIDANADYIDGGGPSVLNTGHYTVMSVFAEDDYDVEKTLTADGRTPDGTYAFHLDGENYVAEYALRWGSILSVENVPLDAGIIKERGIGFDVIIIDQDEGITTASGRKAWSQDGKTTVMDQPWINMDDAGRIDFSWGHCSDESYLQLSSYYETISANEGSTGWITVSSNINWTATSDQSWLLVTPTSYYGSSRLTYKASANTGASREAFVEVDSDFGIRKIRVIQEAYNGISSKYIERLKITPNPATDRVTIKGNADRVQLFNNLGQKVKETAIKGRTFSVADLPKGVYVVKAFSDNNMVGEAKLVKN